MKSRHRNRKQHCGLATIALVAAWLGTLEAAPAAGSLAPLFGDPPAQYRSWPLYWLNAPLEPAALREQIHAMRDQCGFGGFAPLTLRTAKPDYLTEGFFERYALMLETAEKLGLEIIFYDDINFPTATSGGRTWTTGFNDKFKRKHGTDPALLYPALGYDIGPDTEAARVALFGMRAELMSEGFVRTLHEWCAARGIKVSGHPAGNYEPQPVEVSGDNIKFYQHCDIPLFDSIHYYGHGRDGFKLVSSAAFTYDRPITAVEIYGNYPDNSVDKAMLSRSVMEVFARGANQVIPHGMWYEPAKMHIPPEFSHRNPRWGAELPIYNQFVGRCSLLLQGGRHVADVGMLYPVVALQAAYRFDVPGLQQPNWGKDAPRWADYLKISDRLTGSVRRDFTFLHPEILDDRCRVEAATLRLNNATNWEEYRVIIIPGGGMLSYLHKVKDGADLYYFANSSNDRVETWVRLRGKHTLQLWDPHTGAMTPTACAHETLAGQDITRVKLVLEPVKSVFLTGQPRQATNATK